MIHALCKTVINSGNYEYQSMQNKLDVFLLGDRINAEQYTELKGLLDAQQAPVQS